MAKVRLEIVSPDKVVYSADVGMIIVRSVGGELGILPHHAPLATGLVPHAMRIRFEDSTRDEQLIAIAGGFMEVLPDKITILATAAEEPVDIDINRAKQAYQRAKERLERLRVEPQPNPPIDGIRAEMALKRAVARLQATHTEIE